MRTSFVRTAISGLAATFLLATVSVVVGYAAEPPDESPVVGRYTVVSESGGAVWAIQPGGGLVVVGPGDLVSQGTWTEGPERGEFDATLDVEATGQELSVLGAVSPDGRQVALYVSATEATTPADWDPWPPESRLLGDRLAMTAAGTPSPSPAPMDCLRPAWAADTIVDWDRCDDEGPAAVSGTTSGPSD
jgi:hypothetical protein